LELLTTLVFTGCVAVNCNLLISFVLLHFASISGDDAHDSNILHRKCGHHWTELSKTTNCWYI